MTTAEGLERSRAATFAARERIGRYPPRVTADVRRLVRQRNAR